jgi:acyl-CoA thioester hydrolase
LHAEAPTQRPARRDDYARHSVVPTRWQDNDAYGHVNNVVYYSFFDTAITAWLISDAGIDPYGGDTIGLCVASECNYRAPFAFPDVVEAGLRVGRIGESSVRYELALFRAGDDEAAAEGSFVHVYVDSTHRRPTPLPALMRSALETLVVGR